MVESSNSDGSLAHWEEQVTVCCMAKSGRQGFDPGPLPRVFLSSFLAFFTVSNKARKNIFKKRPIAAFKVG